MEKQYTNEYKEQIIKEVQLLYKSKSLRDKDKLDFENALTAMSTAQKTWLKNALVKVYDHKHEWIELL